MFLGGGRRKAHFLLVCFCTAPFCVSSLVVHLTFAATYSFSVWQPSASVLLNKAKHPWEEIAVHSCLMSSAHCDCATNTGPVKQLRVGCVKKFQVRQLYCLGFVWIGIQNSAQTLSISVGENNLTISKISIWYFYIARKAAFLSGFYTPTFWQSFLCMLQL